MPTLVVPARFNGPRASGNGGWSAGALAALLLPPDDAGTPVSVRLHAPPPLETAMDVELSGAPGSRSAVARAGTDVVLTAGEVADDALPPAVPAVDAEAAAATAARYRGRKDHPFPTCFTCGPERAPGDGLRLEPGTLLFRDDVTACLWTPDASLDAGDGAVAVPSVWAALDCPGGWSVDLVGRPIVLGSITAAVHRRPRVQERCVVMGAALATSGRKTLTATTLYDEGGAELARAGHVWVEVDPAAFPQ